VSKTDTVQCPWWGAWSSSSNTGVLRVHRTAYGSKAGDFPKERSMTVKGFSRDQEDLSLKTAWAISLRDPILKMPKMKKDWWSGSSGKASALQV
jgi:hypothetical protein